MVIIECKNWGEFEAPTLEKVSEKIIECLGQYGKTNLDIEEILIDGKALDKKRINEISVDIEHEIYKWISKAEIESEGLRRAQQEAMEAR